MVGANLLLYSAVGWCPASLLMARLGIPAGTIACAPPGYGSSRKTGADVMTYTPRWPKVVCPHRFGVAGRGQSDRRRGPDRSR